MLRYTGEEKQQHTRKTVKATFVLAPSFSKGIICAAPYAMSTLSPTPMAAVTHLLSSYTNITRILYKMLGYFIYEIVKSRME